MLTIGRRSLAQLGAGILGGTPIAGWGLSILKGDGEITTQSPVALALVVGVGVMVLIGVLACTVPTLRALRIMPTEALRES